MSEWGVLFVVIAVYCVVAAAVFPLVKRMQRQAYQRGYSDALDACLGRGPETVHREPGSVTKRLRP